MTTDRPNLVITPKEELKPSVQQSFERNFIEIGRLYGLSGNGQKKKDAVKELEERSKRCHTEYKASMEVIKKEINELAETFKQVNLEGIAQLKSLQNSSNIALQQFVTATEVLTKMNLNEEDRSLALGEIRRASLNIVSNMQEAISRSLDTVKGLNDRLQETDIMANAAKLTNDFLSMKLKAESELFELEKGFREGDSIRQSLSSPPPAPGGGMIPHQT